MLLNPSHGPHRHTFRSQELSEPGSPSNQGQNHRSSGMERYGGHLLQVPSDTLIPAHYFCSTLEGNINNVCMCIDIHGNVCTNTCTSLHVLSLSAARTPGQFPQCCFPSTFHSHIVPHRLRGLALIKSSVSPKLLPTLANQTDTAPFPSAVLCIKLLGSELTRPWF